MTSGAASQRDLFHDEGPWDGDLLDVDGPVIPADSAPRGRNGALVVLVIAAWRRVSGISVQ
jgi:hypothetical protein